MALYLDGQKIISGGSGSGGHTILDNSGTAFEQRTNLQFNGAYSEDNSTDDTTEVNVVREMTKAEFDELTEEEKTGFINITDITSGNDDRFQPIIYSTEEREIGVYTDGKPLYQKTIISTSELSKDAINQIALGITDIDVCVSVSGFASYGSNNTYIPLPYGDKGNSLICLMNINKALSVANVWVGSDYTSPSMVNILIITLRYTKSTDTPGSGQWTPQGVPAHHYSTDEQVVGTWIDGNTLYEKTISFTTPNNSNYIRQSVGLLKTEIDKVWVVDGFTYKDYVYSSVMPYAYTNNTVADDQFEGFINKSSTNVTFDYRVGKDLYEAPAYITIKYTKTST